MRCVGRLRRRHKLVNKLNYAQEIATHYEVFDTMKNDMLRQVLTVSKITQQQTEMHLMMMGRLKEEYEKFKPHPVVEDTKHTWGLVATEALRTIGELGKTAMSSRAMMLAEVTRPALPARSADDDANKALEQAAERAAKKAAAEIAAEAAQAKATAERAEEMLAEVLRRLDRMAEQRPARAGQSVARRSKSRSKRRPSRSSRRPSRSSRRPSRSSRRPSRSRQRRVRARRPTVSASPKMTAITYRAIHRLRRRQAARSQRRRQPKRNRRQKRLRKHRRMRRRLTRADAGRWC
jgi:hypothetical protein